MPGTSDVIYLYDGSFEGLLCCVHESVYTHELPVDIQPEEAAQPTLFRQKYIAADEEKAARVYDSIPRKISPDAAALVQCVFLSCMPGSPLPQPYSILLCNITSAGSYVGVREGYEDLSFRLVEFGWC